MTLKRWKYNILMIILIALIGCYMGMSFFVDNDKAMGIQQGDSEHIEIGNDENTEIVVGDDENEDEDKEFIMPAGALDAVLAGINLLNNGDGYQSSISQSISNTAMGMTVVQNVIGTIEKGVNSQGESVSVENFFFYSNATGVAANQVANYYRGIYVNYDTGAAQVAITPSYNYSSQTYDLFGAIRNDQTNMDSVLTEFGIIQGQGFPFNITKSNSVVTSDDNKSKTFREITIALQVKSLPQGYKNYWLSNGQLENLNYNGSTISFTFKIQKATGAITQIIRNENFSAKLNYSGLNVNVESSVRTIQSFTRINSNVQLADSL